MNFRKCLIVFSLAAAPVLTGCGEHTPQYGTERSLTVQTNRRQIWAIAPAVNLSGQRAVDPLLQADLLYQQLQTVRGVTVIPVNRVAEVYASLKLEKVQSQDQAAIVCELLGCDGLLVPTVMAYDPYSPPKFAASLQLFGKPVGFGIPDNVDPRDLVRSAAAPTQSGMAIPASDKSGAFVQTVGMFDASNGSIRQSLLDYAVGRNDPVGPLGSKEYFVSMDRFCGFAYHSLIAEMISRPQLSQIRR